MEAAKEVSDSILESSAIIPTGTQPNLTLGEDSYAKDGSPTESTKIGEAVDLMEKQKKDLESIKATSNSNSKDVTELEKMKGLHKQLEYEVQILQEQVYTVKDENKIFETQNKNLNIKNGELLSRNNQLEAENASLEQKITDLETQLEAQEKRLELTATELKEYRDRIETDKEQELKREIINLSNSLAKTQGELNVYKTKEAIARVQQNPLSDQQVGEPTPQSSGLGGTSASTASNRLEVEGRFRRLMIESETLSEKAKQDVIRSKEEIKEMRSDIIKDGISAKGRAMFAKTRDNIIEFKQSLKYFQSDAECGLIHATQEHKEKIEAEIKKQDLLMSRVSKTNNDFIAEAESRNIRLIEMSQIDSKMLAVATPKFTGEGSLHVYQFIDNMDAHLKQRGVLHEDSGIVLREFCSGKAKNILDGELRNNANPNADEVKRILVSHFGNRERILLEIQKEHESYGQIPHPCSPGCASDSFSISDHHLVLLGKVEMLTKESIYNPYKTIPIDLGDLKLKGYADSVLPLLPAEFFREFRKDMRGTNADNATILGKLKAILTDINMTALENEQSSYSKEEGRGQRRESAAKTFTAQIQREGECMVCTHLWKEHGRRPPRETHVFYENKMGRVLTRPESCPFISDLNMQERRNFCDSFRLCPICLIHEEDEDHNRENCKFTHKFRSFKCKSQDCFQRYSLCTHHQQLNIEALEKTRKQLEKEHCKFNW